MFLLLKKKKEFISWTLCLKKPKKICVGCDYFPHGVIHGMWLVTLETPVLYHYMFLHCRGKRHWEEWKTTSL